MELIKKEDIKTLEDFRAYQRQQNKIWYQANKEYKKEYQKKYYNNKKANQKAVNI